MKKLITEEITQLLNIVPKWKKRGSVISRTFDFKGFPESIKFVGRVAKAAEKMNHHPDIDIRWNKVTLALTTHDAKGLTENDFILAEQCDKIFLRSRSH